jgi:hypothetical protein
MTELFVLAHRRRARVAIRSLFFGRGLVFTSNEPLDSLGVIFTTRVYGSFRIRLFSADVLRRNRVNFRISW